MPKATEMMIRNGTYIDFANPSAADFGIDEIAWGLSQMCRYSGQGDFFYSVAEHCVILADMVFDVTGDSKLAFQGLMHDATEAFLPDMPKPAKALLPDYRTLEARLWEAICLNVGIEVDIHPVVHHMDVHILAYEGGAMFPTAADRWWEQYGPANNPRYMPRRWSPAVAYLEFWNSVDKYEVFA